MPITPTCPGVYIEEIPSGVRTIVGVATSITAFMGRTVKGLEKDPTTIDNFGDFIRLFGGLHVDYPMSYSIQDFFLNGGSQAIIIRLFKPPAGGDETAKITLGGLKLVAANPGAWGSRLKASVDYTGITVDVAKRYGFSDPAKLFNLSVYEYAKDESVLSRERHINLSVEDGPRRVDRVLIEESALVRVKLKADGSPDLPEPPARPGAATDVVATGGKDSDSLGPTEYKGDEAKKTGLYMLDKTDLFNLLCIPPDIREKDTDQTVYVDAMKYCWKRRAMLIVDPPSAWGKVKDTAAETAKTGLSALNLTGVEARNAALYFPRVRQADSLRENQIDTFVPCGIVAGLMARTDVQRGVWKAPAGIDASLGGVQELQVNLNDGENGWLNPLGINCLRGFPIYGRVAWGARTLRGADQLADEYKYIPVRRTALFIEESLYRGLKWVVFEPNDESLWAQIRLNVGAFMHDLFTQGAFQGTTPRDAYFVKCDKETTTQNDINKGIVNILVGFAPLKPAEFVIIKIQQMAGQIKT